jgi:hypothetical protein
MLCSVTVAFDESVESPELEELTKKGTSNSSVCLTKMANDVTYRRLQQALDRIQQSASSLLVNILLGIRQRENLNQKNQKIFSP